MAKFIFRLQNYRTYFISMYTRIVSVQFSVSVTAGSCTLKTECCLLIEYEALYWGFMQGIIAPFICPQYCPTVNLNDAYFHF